LGTGQTQFALIVFAVSAAVAGVGANLIIFEGETLPVFERNLVFYILLVTAVFISPMFVFMGTLYRAKKKGQQDYSALAMEYVQTSLKSLSFMKSCKNKDHVQISGGIYAAKLRKSTEQLPISPVGTSQPLQPWQL
jgi:hypothetical protein